MSNKRKRGFIVESITERSGTDDQLLAIKKPCTVSASNTKDDSADEQFNQSHPPVPRSPRSLEGEDGGFLYFEPNSSIANRVQEQTARKPERPINDGFLKDLTSPTSKYVTKFKKNRQKMTRRLYRFYNQTVFQNQLPGYMYIGWIKNLTKTAGRTYFREFNGERYSTIELSEKVCDSAERLRDTLIHELCHVACWVINGNGEMAHNQLWKEYCKKVAEILPDLPPITVHHTWELHHSFIYQCSGCQFRVGRWTDSIDTKKFGCGYCKSKLVLVTKP